MYKCAIIVFGRLNFFIFIFLMVPRKWKGSTVLIGESHRMMGASKAEFLLKLTTISTVCELIKREKCIL